MNARIDENGHVVKKGDQIQIGGNERYISRCVESILMKAESGISSPT